MLHLDVSMNRESSSTRIESSSKKRDLDAVLMCLYFLAEFSIERVVFNNFNNFLVV